MRFQARLVVAASVLTLFTLGGAFAGVSFAVNRSQERQLDDALLGSANHEAAHADALGGGALSFSDLPGPSANDVGPLTKYGVIYGPGGSIQATTGAFRCAVPLMAGLPGHRTGFDLWCGSEHLRAITVPVASREGAVILIAAPRTDLDGDAAFLARAMLLALFVSTVWAFAGSTWIVRLLTRDHEAITAVVRRVASGDLTARVATRSSDKEMAQLARDIDEMIAQLDELVSSQQRFIAHAAHELRSPLTTLYGELQHALRKDRDAGEYRAAIEQSFHATQRLKNLAQDLLTMAKVERERGPRTQIAVRTLIDDVLVSVAPVVDARGIRIVVEADETFVLGHAPDLDRMLRNLLENAVHHSPPSGRIRLRATRRDRLVELAIEDEGPGVEVEERDRIFEPFYRNARSRAANPTGSGLGLGIAREIARAHGGDIVVGDPGVPRGLFTATLLSG